MTIEDAIKHCRDTALSNAGNAIAYLKGGQKMLAESCEKCAAEHEQLAKWLEELKQRRKAEPVRKPKMSETDRKECEEWCKDCEHIEMCAWYPFCGCDFRLLPKPEQEVSKDAGSKTD